MKVCVRVNINNPMRRGVMVITASGMTKWIRFFYEKQPHKIFPNCYILNHCQGVCKAASEYLEVVHKKVHMFGNFDDIRKNFSVHPKPVNQIPKAVQRKVIKKTPSSYQKMEQSFSKTLQLM